jgi:hypothetical protein
MIAFLSQPFRCANHPRGLIAARHTWADAARHRKVSLTAPTHPSVSPNPHAPYRADASAERRHRPNPADLRHAGAERIQAHPPIADPSPHRAPIARVAAPEDGPHHQTAVPVRIPFHTPARPHGVPVRDHDPHPAHPTPIRDPAANAKALHNSGNGRGRAPDPIHRLPQTTAHPPGPEDHTGPVHPNPSRPPGTAAPRVHGVPACPPDAADALRPCPAHRPAR